MRFPPSLVPNGALELEIEPLEAKFQQKMPKRGKMVDLPSRYHSLWFWDLNSWPSYRKKFFSDKSSSEAKSWKMKNRDNSNPIAPIRTTNAGDNKPNGLVITCHCGTNRSNRVRVISIFHFSASGFRAWLLRKKIFFPKLGHEFKSGSDIYLCSKV